MPPMSKELRERKFLFILARRKNGVNAFFMTGGKHMRKEIVDKGAQGRLKFDTDHVAQVLMTLAQPADFLL